MNDEKKCCERCLKYETVAKDGKATTDSLERVPVCSASACECHKKEANFLQVSDIIHCLLCEKDIKREEFVRHYMGEPKAEVGEWRERFDRDFDWLNARHTNEQWDAYKDFIATELQRAYEEGRNAKGSSFREGYQRGLEAGAAVERQFILNVLDGIDIANEQLGLPHDTKAIRFALQSRSISAPKEHYEDKGFGSAFDRSSE